VFQYADQPRLFEGATKWNAYVSNPKRIPNGAEAFRMATSGKPGRCTWTSPRT